MLTEAARMGGHKVKGGGGKATYTKYFERGVMFPRGMVLLDSKGETITRERLQYESFFLDATGKKGNASGSSRVLRTFPVIHAWQGELMCYINSPEIGDEIFRRVWEDAGTFIGLGRFRVEVGGTNGLFEAKEIRQVPLGTKLEDRSVEPRKAEPKKAEPRRPKSLSRKAA
jgi:hypothetical protein